MGAITPGNRQPRPCGLALSCLCGSAPSPAHATRPGSGFSDGPRAAADGPWYLGGLGSGPRPPWAASKWGRSGQAAANCQGGGVVKAVKVATTPNDLRNGRHITSLLKRQVASDRRCNHSSGSSLDILADLKIPRSRYSVSLEISNSSLAAITSEPKYT